MFHIVDKNSKDILISSNAACVGEKVGDSSDPIAKAVVSVFDSLNTNVVPDASKDATIKTTAGSYMLCATDIQDTSWVVMSAVPSTILSNSIASMFNDKVYVFSLIKFKI